jgi:hypothetical protein
VADGAGAHSGAERIFDVWLPVDSSLHRRRPNSRQQDGLLCEDVVFGYAPTHRCCTV